MRPEILYPLFASLETLNGVGAATVEKLGKLCKPTIFGLTSLRPYALIDRRHKPEIYAAQDGQVASFEVVVDKHFDPKRSNLPYKIIVSNDSGALELIFFHQRGDYLKKKLVVGEKYFISGRVEVKGEKRQISHPDYVIKASETAKIKQALRIEPQYPLTAGISQNKLQDLMHQALPKLPELPDWQESAKLSFKDAIVQMHEPKSEQDLEGTSTPILRLAADELLAQQLMQAISYRKNKESSSVKADDFELQNELKSSLPFQLTGGQEEALQEINSDMQKGQKMMRLLQGDVGSGKTVVALLATVPLIESGYQIAFMMPTTLLATQQLAAIRKFIGEHNLRAELLTGNVKGKKREQLLAELADGKIDILIGTHALFQDPVIFNKLGLAIIDEQHRFGVEQRLRLAEKNPQAHMLLMSATPIPRTLTMAFFGDMDVSRIMEKPANRKPIKTVAAPIGRIDDLYASIHRALAKDEKIYWICPLVEESEKVNLANVTERFEHLRAEFGGAVGLVHGKMKEEEKAEILQKFYNSEIKILVATTVIEVGIDVPDATVIFIENSNNFGLSQLHQLRGRVGRGEKESSCVLLYDGQLGVNSQARLKVLKNSDDGFEIAEEDLNLRGSGEVLGTRQSGDLNFKFVELPLHKNLLITARDDAREVIASDPELKSERGKKLRLLLHLFEAENNLRYING